ncbi:MAG TPA: biotin/lipoyl-containing protein, partial [Chitinophagaceae bacterium]|nr:biotin/lipoyl-containing protein [Chitinophagaceae bacterium]
MAEVILMPRLSDTMTEGVIAEWHKKIGDTVKKGDLLAEVETDKATMELESYKDGTLLHIGTDKGGKLQVNDLLAIIGNSGEDISNLLKEHAGGGKPSSDKSKTEEKKPEANKETAVKTEEKKTSGTPAMDVSKMEEVVLMPRLSDTMEEGIIAAWHKNVGDMVKKGELLAEIETDKATMDLESYKNGTLLYIGAQKGEKILVNDLLCIIGEKGKVDVDAIVAAAKGGGKEKSGSPAQGGEATRQAAGSTASEGGTQQATVVSEPKTESITENGRLKASPLAKKLAKEKGVDLKMVHGSGDGGRIIKADIDNYTPVLKSAEKTEKATTPQPVFAGIAGEEGHTDIPNSQMRNIIAKRLGESKFSAPHFYLTMEINMDNAIIARTQLNEVSPVKISFNDIVVKAAAMALRQHPAVNASWMGDKIRRHHHIHIGI